MSFMFEREREGDDDVNERLVTLGQSHKLNS